MHVLGSLRETAESQAIQIEASLGSVTATSQRLEDLQRGVEDATHGVDNLKDMVERQSLEIAQCIAEQDSKQTLLDLKEAMEVNAQELEVLKQHMLTAQRNETESARSSSEEVKNTVAGHGRMLQQLMQEVSALQTGLSDEAVCAGLRIELEASRSRQASMEAERKSREKTFLEDRARLQKEVEKLQDRESNLVEQLQQAIVTLPQTPPSAESLTSATAFKNGFHQHLGQMRMSGRVLPQAAASLVIGMVLGRVLPRVLPAISSRVNPFGSRRSPKGAERKTRTTKPAFAAWAQPMFRSTGLAKELFLRRRAEATSFARRLRRRNLHASDRPSADHR